MHEKEQIDDLAELVDLVMSRLDMRQMRELSNLISRRAYSAPTRNEIEVISISPDLQETILARLRAVNDKETLRALTLILSELSKHAVEKNDIELCWTGPRDESFARMTWPALSELMMSAQKSILIVDYSINTNMDPIMDILAERSDNGVKLEFIIDRLSEKSDFLRWVKTLRTKPSLYDRPEDSRDPMSALHVKCVIVDERAAFFGSANLTYHGMKGNLELNLIIRERMTVQKMVALFEWLKSILVIYELGD